MKKNLLRILIVCLIVSSVFSISGCKPKEPIMIGDESFETLQQAVDSAELTATTIYINSDITGAGVVIGDSTGKEQNITIDLRGHTYTVDENTVGSAGTQTNGFQLLKGAKVVLKNGKITSTNAKILIQNYCDLTLDNIVLDTTDCTGNFGQYALSNNCGNTIIKGNTKIYARDGYTAFDLYYWPPRYAEGVSVQFKNFTGEIKGKVEYDTSSASSNWTNYASLTVDENSSGYFDISFATTERLTSAPNITLKGGKYSSDMADLLDQVVDANYKVVNSTYNGNQVLKIVKK